MTTQSRPADEVVISVDSHVLEPDELWDELPKDLQQFRPRSEDLPGGDVVATIEGRRLRLNQLEELTPDDWLCFAATTATFRSRSP